MPPESSAQAQARAFLAQMLQQPGSPEQVRAIQRLMESVTRDEQTAHEVLRRLGGTSVPDAAPPRVVPPSEPALPTVDETIPPPQISTIGRPDPGLPSGPGSLPPRMRGIDPTPRTAGETAEVRRRQIAGTAKPLEIPVAGPAPGSQSGEVPQERDLSGIGASTLDWGALDPEEAKELTDFAEKVELFDIPALMVELRKGGLPFLRGLKQQAKKEAGSLTLRALRPYLAKKFAKVAVPTAVGSAVPGIGTGTGAAIGSALGIGSTVMDVAKLGGRLLRAGWQNIPEATWIQRGLRAGSAPIAAVAGTARLGEGVLNRDPLGTGLGIAEIGLGVGIPTGLASTASRQAARAQAGEGAGATVLEYLSGTPSPAAEEAYRRLVGPLNVPPPRTPEQPGWLKGIDELRGPAEAGDADAQFDLGNKYYTGEGVPEDKAEAVRWYRLAAEQGHAEAQASLRNMPEGAAAAPPVKDGQEAVKSTPAPTSTPVPDPTPPQARAAGGAKLQEALEDPGRREEWRRRRRESQMLGDVQKVSAARAVAKELGLPHHSKMVQALLQGNLAETGLDADQMADAHRRIGERLTSVPWLTDKAYWSRGKRSRRRQAQPVTPAETSPVVDPPVPKQPPVVPPETPTPTSPLEGELLPLPKGGASTESPIFQALRQRLGGIKGLSKAARRARNQETNRILTTKPENLPDEVRAQQQEAIRAGLGDEAVEAVAKTPTDPPDPAAVGRLGQGISDAAREQATQILDAESTEKLLADLDDGFTELEEFIRRLWGMEDMDPQWIGKATSKMRVGSGEFLSPAEEVVRDREWVLAEFDELVKAGALDPEAEGYVAYVKELQEQQQASSAEAKRLQRIQQGRGDLPTPRDIDTPSTPASTDKAPPPTSPPGGPIQVPTRGEAAVRARPPELTADDLKGRSKRARAYQEDYLATEGATDATWRLAKKGDEEALRLVSAAVARTRGEAVTGTVEGAATQLGVRRGAATVPTSPEQLEVLQKQSRAELEELKKIQLAVAGAEEVAEGGVVLSDVPTVAPKFQTVQQELEYLNKLQRSVTALRDEFKIVLGQLGDLPANPEFFKPRGSVPTVYQQELEDLIAQRNRLGANLADQEEALRNLQRHADTRPQGFYERKGARDVPGAQQTPASMPYTGLTTDLPGLDSKLREIIESTWSAPSSTVEGATQAEVLLDSMRRYAQAVRAGVVGTSGRESAQSLFQTHFEKLALHLVDSANEAGRVSPRIIDPSGATKKELDRKPYSLLRFWGEGQKGRTLTGFGPPKGGMPGKRTGEQEGFTFFQSFDKDMADDDTRNAVQMEALTSLRDAFARLQQEGAGAGESAFVSLKPMEDAAEMAAGLRAEGAPEEAQRIWTQFQRMTWARRQALKAEALVQGIWSSETELGPLMRYKSAPFAGKDAKLMNEFQALYEGSTNEITRWANALATSQLPRGSVEWRESLKSGGLRRMEKEARAHPALWGQDIKIPRANLTAWRKRGPKETIKGVHASIGGPEAEGIQGLTVERMGQELEEYLDAVNRAVAPLIQSTTGSSTTNMMLNFGMIPSKHVPAVISGTMGGLGGWAQGENIAAEEGMTGLPAAATKLATTGGGMAFGAAVPGYLAPKLLAPAKGAITGATKVGSLMMNWLLSSPRSILKAWMGAHNGTIYAANERILEGLFEQLGSVRLYRTGDQAEALEAKVRGKGLVKDGLKILKGVGEEDLRFAANLVPKAVRKHLGAFDAFADKSLIKQVFGLDVTTPEGKEAMRDLSAQFRGMSDEEVDALLESDRLDGRLSNAIIGRLFRSADWAFQNIMTKNNVPFEKARQYTLTGTLDTPTAQRALEFFQPPEGRAPGGMGALKEFTSKFVSPVPRVGLQAAERGIERTVAPLHYLAKRAMGASVDPATSSFGALTPRGIPDALAKLTGAGATGALGWMGNEHLNPRLQAYLAPALGPGALPGLIGAGLQQAHHAGTNPLAEVGTRVGREVAPINLEGQVFETGNLGGELMRRLVVPAVVRDWAQIGDTAAPEGRISSGPQLMRALGEGSLDLSGPGGAFLGQAMRSPTLAPWTAGAAAELMLASPYHRRGLPPKPLVNRDVMGQKAFPVAGLPAPPTIPFRQEGWQALRPPTLEEKVEAATELVRGPQPKTFEGNALEALSRLGADVVGRTLFPAYQSGRPVAPTGTDEILQALKTWGVDDPVARRGLPPFQPDPTTGGGIRDPLTNLSTIPQRRGRELAGEVAGQEMAGIYAAVQRMMASGVWDELSAAERQTYISDLRSYMGALPGGGGNRLAGTVWRRTPRP